MVPDPLEQLRCDLRQLDPIDRRRVEVERCKHDVEQLVSERYQDGGFVGEGVGVQADVSAVVIDQAGALAAFQGAVIVGWFGGVPYRDLPLCEAELGAQRGRCAKTTRSTALRSKGSPRKEKVVGFDDGSLASGVLFGCGVEVIEPMDERSVTIVGVVPRKRRIPLRVRGRIK